MPHMYALPSALLSSVSAGGREFQADENNQVDLEGLAPEHINQLVSLVGLTPAEVLEDREAAAALAAEKARSAAEVAQHAKEAHDAALGLDQRREQAQQRDREDQAAVGELEMLRRAQREAEVAAAPIETAPAAQGVEAGGAVSLRGEPPKGLIPPPRARRK